MDRRGRVRRLAVDLSPLRTSRDFRLLWWGEIVSQTGTQVTTVALFVQIFELTDSSTAVGLIGLVQLVPMVLATLLVMPVIDRLDRRRILVGAQAGQALASGLLLLGTLAGDPPLALLYAAAALNGALVSVSLPTRAAMTPRLVAPAQLPAAMALNQVMWNSAMIVGPALGGLVVGRLGLAWAYALDVASYAVALGCAIALRPVPPERDGEARGWEAIREALAFLRGKRVLLSTFVVDIIAMVFGMPRALFPVLADDRFGGGAGIVGLLFSAVALGALLGALTSGWVGSIERQGLAVLWAVTLWGAAITGFGLASVLPLALAFLAVAGGADVISAVFRGTIQQSATPDPLRGRVSAFNILVVAGGPRLGDVEAGVAAAVVGPVGAVVSGGLLCIAGVAVLARRVPEMARWRVGDPA